MIKKLFIRLVPTWVLRRLVIHDYRLRRAGERADRWYWADMALWNRIGWYTMDELHDSKNNLRRLGRGR